MEKIIITEKRLDELIHKEVVKKMTEYIERPRLDEMARVGFIKGRYEVYVWTDDGGYIPHVHIRDTGTKGREFETCVELKTHNYFHHGHYNDVMNSSMKKAFAEFMETEMEEEDGTIRSNYLVAVNAWNKNNSMMKVKPQFVNTPEGKKVVIPDYRCLP